MFKTDHGQFPCAKLFVLDTETWLDLKIFRAPAFRFICQIEIPKTGHVITIHGTANGGDIRRPSAWDPGRMNNIRSIHVARIHRNQEECRSRNSRTSLCSGANIRFGSGRTFTSPGSYFTNWAYWAPGLWELLCCERWMSDITYRLWANTCQYFTSAI